MASKNRTCLCCGEKYSYCPTCSRTDALAPYWKSEFCSETCVTLWSTLTRYGMESLTKDEAKEIIFSLDLKPINVYASCVQRDYAKVIAEEKKPKRGKRVEIRPVDEVILTQEEPVEIKIERLGEVVEPVAIEPPHEVVTEEN